MSSLSKIVDSLELKINVLLKKYHNANRSNESLKEQFEDLKNENTELQRVLESQNQEIKMLKTANALLGSNDYKRETKLKINSLVREIDACVASLAE